MVALIMARLHALYYSIVIRPSQLHDSIPAYPAHYQTHREWVLTVEEWEKALSKHNHLLIKNQNAKARELQNLPLGTNVVVQGENKK